MDGSDSNAMTDLDHSIVIIGVTSRMDRIDPSILRPGRISQILEIKLPDCSTRLDLIRGFFSRMECHELSSNDLLALASKTEGLSGAEIEAKVRECALFTLRENIDSKMVSLTKLIF